MPTMGGTSGLMPITSSARNRGATDMHDSPWHVQWVIRVRRSRSRLACVRCLAPHTGPTLCCRACQVAISDAVEYTRERRRASGECPYCGDPIESGAACARCRERMRVAKARRRSMTMRAG